MLLVVLLNIGILGQIHLAASRRGPLSEQQAEHEVLRALGSSGGKPPCSCIAASFPNPLGDRIFSKPPTSTGVHVYLC